MEGMGLSLVLELAKDNVIQSHHSDVEAES